MRRPVALGFTTLGVTMLMVASGACAEPSGTTDGRATVTHVVDGDTIDVRIGGRDERVRLIGIDTPETKKPNTPIQCYGPEASAFTASILPVGTEIRLERDVVGRDDYGRLLAYVHLADSPTDTFVNREIVARGYAVPLAIEPNTTYAAEFAAAAGRAEADDLGLWAAC
jgi:micrococcal nuclease